MLYTNLKHIESSKDFFNIIQSNDNVIIVIGRMARACVPAYLLAEEMERNFSNIGFFDMEVDNPESKIVFEIPEVLEAKEYPVILFFKNATIKKTYCGIPSQNQMEYLIQKTYKI